MSAGTLTLTNNSDVVTGTGTDFTAEMVAGDFTVVVVGGITYTLTVKSIDSETKLTLSTKFPGPSQNGLAWNVVPRETQNQITATVVAQATEALRGLNYDKQNWQQVFSNSGNITVRLPDGSTFSGPSWNKIAAIVGTLDIDSLQILATQINKDAAQVAADVKSSAASASTASIAAGTATTKAGEASTSAGAATAKAGEASASATLAQKWAANPEDVVVNAGLYSALHYAEKAANSAAEAATHNPNESLARPNNLSDLADRDAAWMNIRPTGSTPIAADAVNDYDAPTLRQVRNMVGAGTAGPTMNGVMNYGVGTPSHWTSRAYIPPYALAMDGQLVKRADWPELWAHAQQHGAIADSEWVADTSRRGFYSTGDGSTTFRLPDFNGARRKGVDGFTGADSVLALFTRGDSGAGAAGVIQEAAAPNIVGNFDFRYGKDSGGTDFAPALGAGGSMSTSVPSGATAAPFQFSANPTTRFQRVSFDASRSSLIYGRSSSELRPNAVIGVWIVRASGGFVAANTSWSVINGDATLPPNGVTAAGGFVKSIYRAAGVDYAATEISSRRTVGSNVATTKITSTSYGSGGSVTQTADYYFGSDGALTVPGGLSSPNGRVASAGVDVSTAGYSSVVVESSAQASSTVGSRNLLEVSNQANPQFYLLRRNRVDTTGQYTIIFPTTAGTLALQGTSGRDFKKDIEDADNSEALNRILAQRMVNYVYKDDEQERVRFGFIAEEAEIVAPQYIKHNDEPVRDILDEDGNKIGQETRDRPSIDNNPIVMDLMGCVQALKAEIDELKAQINGMTN